MEVRLTITGISCSSTLGSSGCSGHTLSHLSPVSQTEPVRIEGAVVNTPKPVSPVVVVLSRESGWRPCKFNVSLHIRMEGIAKPELTKASERLVSFQDERLRTSNQRFEKDSDSPKHEDLESSLPSWENSYGPIYGICCVNKAYYNVIGNPITHHNLK